MKLVKFSFYLLIFFILLRLTACFKVKQLPDSHEMSSFLLQEPLQESISTQTYFFKYEGKEYLIEPVANYELFGLVVTHNNINSIADIYHDSSSVDIKDLCVLWGDNIKNNLQQNIVFWSNAWTCHIEPKTHAAASNFRLDQVSNNHLLSESEEVRNKIKSVNIGDQIYLTGKLINYNERSCSQCKRRSSLIRTDTGDGACEVFMVEKIKIIKKGNQTWNFLNDLSAWAIFLLSFFVPIGFMISAWAQYFKRYGHLR